MGGTYLRGQTTTVGTRGLRSRDQEKRTRRAPLGGYVLVDYSSSGTAAAVGHIVKYKVPRQVDSARLSAARPKKGSQSWLGRLGPTRSAARTKRVSSRHQNTTTAVGLGVCSHLYARSKSKQQPTMHGGVWWALARRMIKKQLAAGVHEKDDEISLSVSSGKKVFFFRVWEDTVGRRLQVLAS